MLNKSKRMDILGNIIEDREEDELEELIEDIKEEKEEERALVELHLDDEVMNLTETGCPFDTENLFECPEFDPVEEDDPELSEVIECSICGRYDWRHKTRGFI